MVLGKNVRSVTFGYVLSEEEQDWFPPPTRKLAIALIETQSKKNWKRHKNAGPWTTSDSRAGVFGMNSIRNSWGEEIETRFEGCELKRERELRWRKKASVGMKLPKFKLQHETSPVGARHQMLPKQPCIRRDGEKKKKKCYAIVASALHKNAQP